jgi:hypothetical protein
MKATKLVPAGSSPKRSRKHGLMSCRCSAETFHLVYLKACEGHCHPRLAKGSRRPDQALRAPAPGEDRKSIVFGAVDYASGRRGRQINGAKNRTAFAAVFEHPAWTFPTGSIAAVFDKSGRHKSHDVRRRWVHQRARRRPL